MLHNVGLADRDLVIFERDVFFSESIEYLRLKEEHRVVIPNAGEQQSFSLNRASRIDNIETRGVGEIAFDAL